MKQIILAGLISDNNLGDKVIADCTEYLYKNETKNNSEINYKWIDLVGLTVLQNKKPFIIRKFNGALYHFKIKTGHIGIQNIVKSFENYFEPLIKNADLIVVVGGGLIKYKYQYFWAQISGLINAASKQNIPVVLNALGVEGYEENDLKCQYLKKSLNSTTVQTITTRDDIKTLKDFYLKNNTHCIPKLVADSAVFAAETYQVKPVRSNIIGIGLIRGNIFTDNGLPFPKEKLAELYANLLTELDNQKINYQIFTNGLQVDLDLVEQIFSRIGKPVELKSILIPKTPAELVQIISNFKGVIAARLHACIISYSLKIPCVGVVWNDKLSLFGNITGYADRFIEIKDFDANYIISQFQKAVDESYQIESLNRYKLTIKESINEILTANNII
jgi:polysaccharide pyruvyl transferase WcaK-like protein